MQQNKNTKKLHQKTKAIMWQLKQLIQLQQMDLKQLFKQYDKNGLLQFPDFCRLMSMIDNQIDYKHIQLVFNDLDYNNNGSINFQELKAVFDRIDMEKDSPFYIDQDSKMEIEEEQLLAKKEQQQDPYYGLIQKFASLRSKHEKKEININELIEIYTGGEDKIPIQTVFTIMETCELTLNNAEQNEVYQLLGDQPVKITILLEEFLQLECGNNPNSNSTSIADQINNNNKNQLNNNNNLLNPQYKQNNNINQNSDNTINTNISIPSNLINLTNSVIIKDGTNNNNNQNNTNNHNHRNGKQNNNNIPVNPMIDEEAKNAEISISSALSQLQLKKRQSSSSFMFNFEDFYQIDEMIPGIEEFLTVFTNCMQYNTNYVDPQFPPSPNSISTDKKDIRYYPQREKYSWLRPNQIFKGKISVFQKCEALLTSRIGMGKYISPRDIRQGQLGDCYFLSALSSMADKPERILKLFITKIYNGIGVYCVKLCHDGEWKAITLDDYFPCYNQYSGPAFSKANGNELWVLLMEKAYAKLYKSYARIERGFNIDAFSDLTGAPSYNIQTQDSQTGNFNEKLYDELMYALSFGDYMVTAGSNDEIDTYLQSQTGLVGSHAYTVLKIINIQHPTQGPVTLIKLRNPWGKTEWKGDFSDKSQFWTPQLKNELNIQNKPDGIFYMTLYDFQKYFSYCAICCYHDNYQYASIRLKSDWRHAQYLRFEVKQAGTYYISLFQKSKRNYPRNDDHKYSKSKILLSKILPDQNFKYIDSKQSNHHKDIFVSGYLTEGVYYIYAKIEWLGDKQQEFVLGGYGPEKLEFEKVEKNLVSHMIESSLKQQATTSGELRNYSNNKFIQKLTKFDLNKGFGYIYVTNQSQQTIETTFTLQNESGLKIRKPFRNMSVQFYVMPNQDAIAVFTIDPKGYSYQISEKYIIHK